MTRLQQKIIEFLSDYPEKEFYAQEIAKRVKCSKASASGILKLLVERKIVSKKVKGHMKFYQIDPKNPEVKKFKINLALAKINLVLPKLKKFSKRIVLFGSSSRGERTSDSDIDLFILTNEKDEVFSALKKINARIRLKAIVKTPSEWSETEIKEPEFYQEIKNGIILHDYVPRI